MKKFKVILMGSDDNVYGMARSVYEEYKEKSLALAYSHMSVTKYSNIVDVMVIDKFNIEENCINALIDIGKKLKNEYEHLILIPCSDSYMEMVIKNESKLHDIYDNRFISYSLLKEFITKDKFYKLCDKFNIDYPKTIIVNKSNYKNISIPFSYPIILKPNNSNSSDYLYSTFNNKKKVYLINSYEELINTIDNIYSSTYNDNLIIQEYIKGDDTSNRVVNCYSNKYGKVVMMSLGRPILEEYAPSLLGNYASIISEPGYHKVFDNLKKLLEMVNYRGFSNFDLKYDKEKNKYYVFEINYRQGRSSFYVNASGISLAKLLIDDLVDNKTNNEITYSKEKVLWLNIPESVLLKYLKNIEVRDEVLKLINNKKYVHTLFFNEDKSILRNNKMIIHYYNKKRQYRKYYIEKE